MSQKSDDVEKQPPSTTSGGDPLPTGDGDPGGLPPPEDGKTKSTKVEATGDPGGLPPPEDPKTR